MRYICVVSIVFLQERDSCVLPQKQIFHLIRLVGILLFKRDSRGIGPGSSVGDPGLILGLGRSPGEGNGNPLQYSCLENPMDKGARLQSMGLQELDMT